MSDTLRNTCDTCSMPEQLIGLPCGFCGATVKATAEQLDQGGRVKVAEIIGWKGLDVKYTASREARLQSPAFGVDGHWTPGEWMIARCFKSGRTAAKLVDACSHHADNPNMDWVPPVKDCTGKDHGCGYYAGRTREHLMGMGYQRYNEQQPTVLAEVQLAGKMYPATNGWRAQKIRPRRLHVPHELWRVAADLETAYGPHGVEIVIGTTIILPKDETPDWCPKCSAKWADRGLTCGFCGHTLNG